MGFKSIVGAVCTCLAVVSFNVNSALVEASWEYYSSPNTSLTLDTDTELEWLDLSKTTNKSHLQLLSDMGTNGRFEGFRLANSSELSVFLTNAGIIRSGFNPNAVGEGDNMRALFDLLGGVWNCCDIYGQYDNGSGNGNAVWKLGLITGDYYTSSYRVYSSYSYTYSAQNIGSFLVRDASVVPIPSAIWLFGSGLIGLMGLARRKANV